MNREQLFSIIRELRLPEKEFAIFGGACLTVRGIRETEDLEIFVTNSLFKNLLNSGWKQRITNSTQSVYVTEEVDGVAVLAFERCGSDKWVPDVNSYINHPEMIDGVPFMPLSAMRAWKYNTARPKDLADVRLIDKFLQK